VKIVKHVQVGATEKALFGYDGFLKVRSYPEQNNGVGLSTLESGPATISSKRTDMGYFLLAVFAEVYEDLAARQVVRTA
jgi:hypothetical protein